MTSTIDPRLVYNVIYKGDNNKFGVQKQMIVSFLFVLKFKFLRTTFLTKKHVWHEQDTVYARTVQWQYMVYLRYTFLTYVDMQILQSVRMC